MRYDKPKVVSIKKIIEENSRVKSFLFDLEIQAKPGQFVMVWIPGYDEKPFGVILKDSIGLMITVAAVGRSTKALHQMKVGNLIGIRGAYGSHFHLPSSARSIALVAGGYGMVPLAYLAQEARKKNINVELFLGARTQKELLFASWMKEIGVKLHLSTDDGSVGHHGFVTEPFAEYVKNKQTDQVYVVGPEIMEYKVAQICYKKQVPFEVSVERYMKCGLGICGQCCVDNTGWRMCVEGPIINGEDLKKIIEFGKYHRTASGKVEYFPWVKKTKN